MILEIIGDFFRGATDHIDSAKIAITNAIALTIAVEHKAKMVNNEIKTVTNKRELKKVV